MPTAYGRSLSYWRMFGWAMVAAVLSGGAALLYVVVVDFGTELLWPEAERYGLPFSGSWQIAAVMTGMGLLVGLIHRLLNAKELDAIDSMAEGRLEPKLVPGSVLVSIFSLIGGFSLGPEVPAGILAAGLPTWLAERRGLDAETKRVGVASGVLSAYSGIFSSPLSVMLAPLELRHRQGARYFGTLLITTVAAVVGYAIFVATTSTEFGQVVSVLTLPVYSLKLWHIVLGLGLGILGAGVALIFGLLVRTLTGLAAPLQTRPLLRGGLSGLAIGLVSMALPLTMFYGAEQLALITERAAEIGVAMLLLLALAKVLVTAGALATGFIGGPVFPLFFVGGSLGMILHLWFPQIPPALAVACLMAAIPAALQPIPVTLAVVVLFIAGIPVADAIPVMVAALSAHFITHGLGLIHPRNEEAREKLDEEFREESAQA